MTKWAKIIEVDGHQVVYWNEPTNVTATLYDMHQLINCGGEIVDMMIKGIPENQIEKYMDELDEESAKTALKIIQEVVEDYDRQSDAKLGLN
jgi:hypothetical protein